MSEIAFLAQRYNHISNLLEAVNHSVELLKISHYGLSGSEMITEEELSDARNYLVSVISTLIDKKTANPFMMTGEFAASLSQESDERLATIRHRSASILQDDERLHISPTHYKHLHRQRKKTIKSHMERMKKLKSRLEKAQPLSEEALQELDQLCFDLDAEATKIFHRLRKM